MNRPTDPLELVARRKGTGSVLIGPDPVGSAGLGTIAIPGGLIVVDPARLDGAVTLTVADLDLAFDSLVELLGTAAAESCRVVGLGRSASARVLVPRSEPLLSIRRLGLLRWLDAGAPWPLDEPLLRLEAALTALRCAYLLDDTAPSEDYLMDSADALLATLAGAELAPTVAPLVVEAAGLLQGLLLVDDPRVDAFDALLRGGPAPESWPGPTWVLDRAARSCVPVGAATAGQDAPDELITDSCAADWTRVRRGTIGRDETSVTWAAEIGSEGGAVVSVTAGAAGSVVSRLPLLEATGPQVRGLSFSVHTPGWPAPVAGGALTHRPEWGTWMGVAHLGLAATSELTAALRSGARVTVDVHEVDRPFVPGGSADPITAEAVRWSSRGVSAARLAWAGCEPGVMTDAAIAALVRAQRLWRVAGGADSPQRAEQVSELLAAVRQGERGIDDLTVTETESVARR